MVRGMFDGTYEDYMRSAESGSSKTAILTRAQWEMMRDFDRDARRNAEVLGTVDYGTGDGETGW